MQLHYTIWQGGPFGPEPIATWSPAGMTSSVQAREDARRTVLERKIPAVLLTIEARDGDGTILEEWQWKRGEWRSATPGTSA